MFYIKVNTIILCKVRTSSLLDCHHGLIYVNNKIYNTKFPLYSEGNVQKFREHKEILMTETGLKEESFTSAISQ